MKLVKMAWLLGGVAAFGLGMLAEGCSSSSNTTTTGTGTGCASLTACCAMLSGTNLSQCTNVAGMANDTECTSYLAEIQGSNLCTGSTGSGTSTTPGSGTSTTPGSGTSTTPGSGTSGTSGSGTGTTSSDAGAGADCEAPPKFYPVTKAGPYCPFVTDAGKGAACAAGEDCCEPAEGMGASTCVAGGTACPVAGSTDWQCEGAVDCAAGTTCCGTGTVQSQAACGSNPAYPYISKFTGSSCAASCASTYQICGAASGECPSGQSCVAVDPKGNSIGICQ